MDGAEGTIEVPVWTAPSSRAWAPDERIWQSQLETPEGRVWKAYPHNTFAVSSGPLLKLLLRYVHEVCHAGPAMVLRYLSRTGPVGARMWPLQAKVTRGDEDGVPYTADVELEWRLGEGWRVDSAIVTDVGVFTTIFGHECRAVAKWKQDVRRELDGVELSGVVEHMKHLTDWEAANNGEPMQGWCLEVTKVTQRWAGPLSEVPHVG